MTHYIQLTRHNGDSLQVPSQVLSSARIVTNQVGTFLYYADGQYDHIQETPEKIQMAVAGTENLPPTRPKDPIDKNLDFSRALRLVQENPELRCLVSHEWAAYNGQLFRYMSLNQTPAYADEFQQNWRDGVGGKREGGAISGPTVTEALGLWDVYYLPEDHVWISMK